jgi:hypothetical protein
MSFIKNPSLITAYSALATVALGLLGYDLLKPANSAPEFAHSLGMGEEMVIASEASGMPSLFSVDSLDGDDGTRLAQRASALKASAAQ